MAMAQSADRGAKSRYTQAFQSSIFDPLPTPEGPAFVPAGKRRDQTTSEMFGSYDEKDLKGMPKTFVPKDDRLTARQRKMNFLSSGVLPGGPAYPCSRSAPEPLAPNPQPEQFTAEGDADENVDTNMRPQPELHSNPFGRETPGIDKQRLHHPLTPNDFQWHSHPETIQKPVGAEHLSHREGAYQEKCSGLFDHRSPQTRGSHLETEEEAREEATEGDIKRRANAYYSDLSGRGAPMDMPPQSDAPCRPQIKGSHEDRITVRQGWTNSKTELLPGARSPKNENPSARKSNELHQVRIFGQQPGDGWQPPEKVTPMMYDNAQKLRSAIGRPTQEIHQAHLRSSTTPDEFYEEAENTKHWEVVELHISGLGSSADDAYVRNLCQGFDLQLVKVVAEIDPVRNLCKGRAKVMVRYNPGRDSITGLVRKLEEHKLRVEL